MSHVSPDLTGADIESYLAAHERKTMLRFITCGSVDDGKSTLIGRLLYDSKLVFEDHLVALEADSKQVGTQGGELDFALLVDGLAAEREQGITIDVAYRFFTTALALQSQTGGGLTEADRRRPAISCSIWFSES